MSAEGGGEVKEKVAKKKVSSEKPYGEKKRKLNLADEFREMAKKKRIETEDKAKKFWREQMADLFKKLKEAAKAGEPHYIFEVPETAKDYREYLKRKLTGEKYGFKVHIKQTSLVISWPEEK